MRFTLPVTLLLTSLSLASTYGEEINFDYKKADLPIEKRVEVLLSQMTLEEKVKQLTQGLAGDNNNPNNQNPKVDKFDALLGSVIFGTDNVYERNAIQKQVMEKSRLGIPLLFGDDIIHGYRTMFPSPLAQSCSWNPSLIEESCRVAALEGKSAGIDWTFSPMIDIARDARWGRMMEGYGEDPYATSVYTRAAVRGYQGETMPYRMAACLKHYVAYGASEGGRDYAYTEVSRQTLWDTYLPPYEAGVEAGALTLMSGFNDISGIPATANHYTLTEVLRGKWDFRGFVVSDWHSMAQLQTHGFVADHAEAAAKSINAGLDMDMIDGIYPAHLANQVKEGNVSEKTIDESVARVLRVKFQLGLFDNPYTPVEEREKRYLLPEYRKAAYQSAVESMVLLKNDDKALPITNKIKNVALIGPLVKAKNDLMGGWSARGRAEDVIDIEEGLRKAAPKGMKIKYAQGCDINSDKTDRFAEAMEIARNSDIVILCVGESRGMSGENTSRSSLSLPGVQEQLIDEIAKTGKPVVLLVTSGRAISFHKIEPKVKSILMTWHLGTEAGNAIAALLFGNENPSGRLSITLPRTEGQIPIYYNMRSRGRRHQGFYQDISTDPMYWFGHGLSYTSYDYTDFKVSHNEFTASDNLTVSVNVRNTGEKTGKETVFLYMHDVAASITQPMKRLIGFEKVELKPNESKTVTFTLEPQKDMSFANDKGDKLLEPGKFVLMVDKHKKDVFLKK